MLDGFEYAISWAVYLLAAFGLICVWWRMTRPIKWYFPRQLLRIVPAVTLLAPAPVAQGAADWAPAIFVLMFDLTLVEGSEPARALTFLLYGLIIAFIVLVVDILVRKQPVKAH